MSGNELLTIAEQDTRLKESHIKDLCFGFFDIAIAMILFLPFFGQKADSTIDEVSLLSLTDIAPYLKFSFIAVVISVIFYGILTLALQNCTNTFWTSAKSKISLILNTISTVLFIISSQPYAAVFCFIFLIIKALMLIKWH